MSAPTVPRRPTGTVSPLAHRPLPHDHALACRRSPSSSSTALGGSLTTSPPWKLDEREHLAADAEALAAEHRADVDAGPLEVVAAAIGSKIACARAMAAASVVMYDRVGRSRRQGV